MTHVGIAHAGTGPKREERLARDVLRTPHNVLCGEGATRDAPSVIVHHGTVRAAGGNRDMASSALKED